MTTTPYTCNIEQDYRTDVVRPVDSLPIIGDRHSVTTKLKKYHPVKNNLEDCIGPYVTIVAWKDPGARRIGYLLQ